MYGNGLWNMALVPDILVLFKVVLTTIRALTVQLLTVTASMRLSATSILVLGHHFTSSTDHWFEEPEKVN